ncbi:efflux RND transporter periplasmic adaptor subunit [Sinimarinibacterium thermocellulolyticum]|uniref:Efflux RND transporter periplasmic adaptor subunit n=1 Tax=Sinimarinibacterium thermocellulolyticum TaxID=3170016 RepID=A0ABV2ACP0_9GAMM
MTRGSTAACLLAVGVLLAACNDAAPGTNGAKTAAAVRVKTMAVGARALERELLAVGSLRADESVTVRSEIAGRIVGIGFAEGQAVERGQMLVELDDSIPRAELERARAAHALAQRSARRADELYARKLLAAAERDQAAASLELAAAELALAEARLDKTRILAPFAGIAGLRTVSPGDYIAAGQDLTVVEALQTMKVDFRIDQRHLPALRVGQPLELAVDAYPGERFLGEVYAIEPRIAESSRSVALRGRVPNHALRLRPGQFAQIRLVLERIDEAIVIPERALFPRGEQQFVYVADDDQARLREVRVGQRLDGHAQILSGLRAGEQLIVSGIQHIGDGTVIITSPFEQSP